MSNKNGDAKKVSKRREKIQFTVPDEVMIAAAEPIHRRLGTSPEDWFSTHYEEVRSRLPLEHQATSLDMIRIQLNRLRKRSSNNKSRLQKSTEQGHGAKKGSRAAKKDSESPKVHVVPQWYIDYTNSDYWKFRRPEWLSFYKKCCACGRTDHLDVHHNDYSRLYNELFTDCIVFCRECHDWFHEKGRMVYPEQSPL